MTATESNQLVEKFQEAIDLARREGLAAPDAPRNLTQAEGLLATMRQRIASRDENERRALLQAEEARINKRVILTVGERAAIEARVTAIMAERSAARAKAAAIAKPHPKPKLSRAELLARFAARKRATGKPATVTKPLTVTTSPPKPSAPAPKPAPVTKPSAPEPIVDACRPGHQHDPAKFSDASRSSWRKYFSLGTASERTQFWRDNRAVLESR